ncbi:alpha/beta fold hydrolase [Bacillus bingmayongensis]|uniref:alpha/beta fold hydrolase n=1 Tax=Bacillus bingmayongensis TaxID=1150157 RepID=UPI00035CB0BB|nr:alpha/beta hydrolase [Bacillus bingmayongensis]MBY0595389.1 alpha/beta hydrolase [Bacillus bingmayongensis]
MLECFFHTGDVRLHYVKSNSKGVPILLLHGGISRWEAFQTIIPELENEGHVYAIDLRGHGKSGRVTNGYHVKDYVQDIISFIEECMTEPPIIFGHSLGGMIGIQVTAEYPELVKGLIIGDSPMSLEVLKEGSEKLRKWKGIVQKGAATNQNMMAKKGENPLLDFMIESVMLTDPQVLDVMIDHCDETYMGYDMNTLLPKIQCPVLLLQGNPERNGVVRDSDVKKALGLLPNAKHVKLENAGHTLHIEDKAAVLDAIVPFIQLNNK